MQLFQKNIYSLPTYDASDVRLEDAKNAVCTNVNLRPVLLLICCITSAFVFIRRSQGAARVEWRGCAEHSSVPPWLGEPGGWPLGACCICGRG